MSEHLMSAKNLLKMASDDYPERFQCSAVRDLFAGLREIIRHLEEDLAQRFPPGECSKLQSPAEAKPDIGLECERCKIAGVGATILDLLKQGWTILNQRVDYLCPECSKAKPEVKPNAVLRCDQCSAVWHSHWPVKCQDGWNLYICPSCSKAKPLPCSEVHPEYDVYHPEGHEPKPDADSAGEPAGFGEGRDYWKSRAMEAESDRDGWIKRYEVVKGQYDKLKAGGWGWKPGAEATEGGP